PDGAAPDKHLPPAQIHDRGAGRRRPFSNLPDSSVFRFAGPRVGAIAIPPAANAAAPRLRSPALVASSHSWLDLRAGAPTRGECSPDAQPQSAARTGQPWLPPVLAPLQI